MCKFSSKPNQTVDINTDKTNPKLSYRLHLSSKTALLLAAITLSFTSANDANAGQCLGGLNYHPITKVRQPNYDFLCAGAGFYNDVFQRNLDGEGWDDDDDDDESSDEAPEFDDRWQEEINHYKMLLARVTGPVDDNALKPDINWLKELIAQLDEVDRNLNFDDLWIGSDGREALANRWHKKNIANRADSKAHEISVATSPSNTKILWRNDTKTTVVRAVIANKLRAKIANLTAQQSAARQAHNSKYGISGNHQSANGFAPDADILDRLKRAEWWFSGSAFHSDQTKAGRKGTSDTLGTQIGVDVRLGGNSGVGLGLGYNNTKAKQQAPYGGTTTIDSVNFLLRGYWGPSSKVTFDGTVSAAYSSAEQFVAAYSFSDRYNAYNYGIGAGVSTYHDFNDMWRLSGRLGWSGSVAVRKASTDSTGTRHTRNQDTFSHVTAQGTLTRKFANNKGSLSLNSKLYYVTHDNGAVNNSDPFHAEVGLTGKMRLSENAVLSGSGFVSQLGRSDQTGYGGSLKLQVNY